MWVDAVYWGLLALLTVAVFQRPARAVAAILCLYGLKQWSMATSHFFLDNRTITNFACAGILGLGLVMTVVKRRFQLGVYPRAGWATVGLFVLAAVSFLWTHNRGFFVSQWQNNWPYVLTFILIAPLLIVEPRDLRDALVATMVLGTVIVILLMTTVDWRGRHIAWVRTIRYMGGHSEAMGNPLAAAELAGFVFLTGVLIHFRRLTWFWWLVRWGVVVLSGLALVVRSGSRGQFAAMLAALLVFLPLSRRIKNVSNFVVVGFSLLFVGAVTHWAFSEYAERGRWEPDKMLNAIYTGRLQTSLSLLTYWLDQGPVAWIVGVGNSASFDLGVVGFYPEVHVVEVLGELGLLGLTLWGTLVVLTGRTVRRLWKVASADGSRDLCGLVAAVGALTLFEFLLTFKQGNMIGYPHFYCFAIILGRFDVALAAQSQDLPLASDRGWDAGEQQGYDLPALAPGHAQPAYGYGYGLDYRQQGV